MNKFYKTKKVNSTVVITLLEAEISMEENENLKKELYRLIEEEKGNILMNLSKIVFISSILLSSLVVLLKRAKDLGKELCLCALQDPVKEVFKITGIIKVFNIYNTEEIALKNMKRR